MKKVSLGVVLGLVVGLLVGTMALADAPIKLFVDGKEIVCDVPPQIIDGRTMVPARYVAEALGATVEWDGANNSVLIHSAGQAAAKAPEGVKEEVSSDITYVDVNVTIDGVPLTLNNGVIFEYGQYYLPAVEVCEAIGATVQYSNSTFTVSYGGKQSSTVVGSRFVTMPDGEVDFSAPLKDVEGVPYLTVRGISEMFSFEQGEHYRISDIGIMWYQDTMTVDYYHV